MCWPRIALGEIADLALGKMLDTARSVRGTPMTYLRNLNVRWDAFDLNDLLEMPFQPHEVERYTVRAGDVVVCEGGEPGRAALWQGAPIMFQKALHRVRPREGVLDPRWLVWHLRHDAGTGRLTEYFTGTTIKHFTGTALSRYRIAVPPIAEQRRIVDKLDDLSARVSVARTALEAVLELMGRHRRSVYSSAVSGNLTEAFRAGHGRAVSAWGRVRLGDLIESIEAGINVKCEERPPDPGEKGLVKISAVSWGHYDDTESKTLPRDALIAESTRIRPGTFSSHALIRSSWSELA